MMTLLCVKITQIPIKKPTGNFFGSKGDSSATNCFDKSRKIKMFHVNVGSSDQTEKPKEAQWKNTKKGPGLDTTCVNKPGFVCCDGSISDLKKGCFSCAVEDIDKIAYVGPRLYDKYVLKANYEMTIRRKQLKKAKLCKTKITQAINLMQDMNLKSVASIPLLQTLDSIVDELTEAYQNMEETRKNALKELMKESSNFKFKNETNMYNNILNHMMWVPSFESALPRIQQSLNLCDQIISQFNGYFDHRTIDHKLKKLKDQVQKIDSAINKVEETFLIDLGENYVYAPLFKQRFYANLDGYSIQLKPFSEATRTKKDNQDTIHEHLGYYHSSGPLKWYFKTSPTDKVQRETEVDLHCRLQDGIIGFEDEGNGKFHIDFGTPAACTEDYINENIFTWDDEGEANSEL